MRRYRIFTRCRIGGRRVTIIANMKRLACGVWRVRNDGQLRVASDGRALGRAWLAEHWDAVVDALADAGEAFVLDPRALERRSG